MHRFLCIIIIFVSLQSEEFHEHYFFLLLINIPSNNLIETAIKVPFVNESTNITKSQVAKGIVAKGSILEISATLTQWHNYG